MAKKTGATELGGEGAAYHEDQSKPWHHELVLVAARRRVSRWIGGDFRSLRHTLGIDHIDKQLRGARARARYQAGRIGIPPRTVQAWLFRARS